MNWTANNIHNYEDRKLQASNGQKYRWYTNSSSEMVLRIDGPFGLVILKTYDLNDLLLVMNTMQMKPVS